MFCFPVVHQAGTSQKHLELYTSRLSIGQLDRCLSPGVSLDNQVATLVCWLDCPGIPGKATRLFVEAAFAAIYCTGGQCGRYTSTTPVLCPILGKFRGIF